MPPPRDLIRRLSREFANPLAALGERGAILLETVGAEELPARQRLAIFAWLRHVAPHWEFAEVVRAMKELTTEPPQWVSLFDGRYVRRAEAADKRFYDPVHDDWQDEREWTVVTSLNVRRSLEISHVPTESPGAAPDDVGSAVRPVRPA